MAYINIDKENRITAASYEFHCGPNEYIIDIPSGINLKDIHKYLYINNELIYSPIPESTESFEQEEEPIEDLLAEIIANHEYRLCLIELGVTENDL